MDAFREALTLYLDKLRSEYDVLLTRELADIEDARRNHGTVAENSWKPRLKAERRISAAVGILEALV